MLFDSASSSSLAGGGIALSIIAYGLFSGFVAGPLIIERMVEKSGWIAHCERTVKSELMQSLPEPNYAPQFNCDAMVNGLFGGNGREMCQLINPLSSMVEQVNRQKMRVAEYRRQRLIEKAKQAGSSCRCAISTFVENKRISVGIYSASARLILPPSIQNLDSELTSARNAPLCAERGAP